THALHRGCGQDGASVDLDSHAPERDTWVVSTSAYSVALDPRGERVVSAGWGGWIRVHDAATGALVRKWQGHETSGVAAAWSSDGRTLATTGNDGRVALWD